MGGWVGGSLVPQTPICAHVKEGLVILCTSCSKFWEYGGGYQSNPLVCNKHYIVHQMFSDFL